MAGGRRLGGIAGAGAVAAMLAAAPAHADLIATLDSGSASQIEYALKRVNATTGQALALPAGINQRGRQHHPSASPGGRYLVFLRIVDGARRVLMLDRLTGRTADLLNAFEAASHQPATPTFSADGTRVLTGRRLERLDPAAPPDTLQASFVEIDVSNFPNGPFPKRIVQVPGADSTSAGRTLQPTPFSPTAAFGFGIEPSASQAPARVAVQQAGATTMLADPVEPLRNPTISRAADVVVYEQGEPGQTRLVFRSLDGLGNGPAIPLPGLVNAHDTFVRVPEFSRDGRYLAFVRRPRSSSESGRLFVWDTETQLMLNPDGVPGFHAHFSDSAIALEQRRVFRPRVAIGGVLAQFGVLDETLVDMVVQRVVGTTTVLGRRAPRLRVVGRERLGRFAPARAMRRARWDGRVGRRELPPGDYLVTLRSVTRGGEVREHAEPERVRIR